MTPHANRMRERIGAKIHAHIHIKKLIPNGFLYTKHFYYFEKLTYRYYSELLQHIDHILHHSESAEMLNANLSGASIYGQKNDQER